jgi:hypothetical protein
MNLWEAVVILRGTAESIVQAAERFAQNGSGSGSGSRRDASYLLAPKIRAENGNGRPKAVQVRGEREAVQEIYNFV